MPWIHLSFYECMTIAIQAGGIAIVAWYTVLTGRQVRAFVESNATNRLALAETQRSNDIARDALTLSRRAWLIPEISGAPMLGIGAPGKVQVTVCNIGNMPATRVEFAVLPMLQPGITLYFQPPLDLTPSTPLGVQQRFHCTVALDQLGDLRKAIGKEDRWLHIVGSVRYDDGFGILRQIHFGWYASGRHLDEWRFTPGVHHLE